MHTDREASKQAAKYFLGKSCVVVDDDDVVSTALGN